MKKLSLILLLFISLRQFAFSQTNTFPASGNVGIGTTNPRGLLDVTGGSSVNNFMFLSTAGTYGSILKFGSIISNLRQESQIQYQNIFGIFDTNASGTTRFYIDPNGNVGIGTNSPTTRFDVYNAPSATPLTGAFNFSSATAGTAFWGFRLAPTTYDFNLDVNDGTITAAALMVQRATYNVGIGTTAPNAALSVQKAITGNTAMLSLNEAGNNGSNAMSVDWRFGGSSSFPFGTSGVTGRIANERQTTTANFDLAFYNTAATGGLTERMRIFANGNIGIGTSNALGYKLAVNGSMIATAVTVKLYANWPDYVFNKDYRLAALSDVKTFIDQNHHLPDMPSENEVAKDGINLGDMNRLLTKKVEELTLYLIDKDKQIKEQDARIQKQEALQKQMAAQLEILMAGKTKNN